MVSVLVAACGGRSALSIGSVGDSGSEGGRGSAVNDAAAPDAGDSAEYDAEGDAPGFDSSDTGLDAGPPEFPPGVYDQCALIVTAGNTDLQCGGDARTPTTITVTDSGGVTTATLAGFPCVSGAVEFLATTDGTAGVLPGQSVLLAPVCVAYGAGTPGTLSIVAGSLTLDESTLFMTLVGTGAPDAGPPCTHQITMTANCSKG